ncbi:MAG: ACT domain-containing protein [Clostridia bacterium]|nr:ACT domain-containing protein [Clostridia bacterium]
MKLKLLPMEFTVCQLPEGAMIDFTAPYCFFAKTDEETSLVCPTALCPKHTLNRRDGWLALKIEGPLDFSLIGVLAGVAGTLAEAGVPIFAVSTYDTDYVLFEKEHRENALKALADAGHRIGA